MAAKITTTAAKRARSPHQPVGRWIRPEKRLAIYLRDSFRCVYCGTDLHHAHVADVTLDHLVAKVDGGSNEADNLVTACRGCNCARQDRPWAAFASPEARKIVRRNVKRSLKVTLPLAKAIIEGREPMPGC